MEENQQELMFKLSMFEQQIKHLQEQIGAVENALIDMQQLLIGLDEFKGSKGREIMAPVGRGIFVKSKIDSEELVVDIGEGNFITKNVDGTKEMIEKQVKKLIEVKEELNNNLEKTGEEITGILNSAE